MSYTDARSTHHTYDAWAFFRAVNALKGETGIGIGVLAVDSGAGK